MRISVAPIDNAGTYSANRVGLPALLVASLRAEFGGRLNRNGICRKRRKRVDPHENGPQLGIEMSSGARARAGEVIE